MSFIEYSGKDSAFKKPLEDVLILFYTVEDLWLPMRDLLYPALGYGIPDKRPKKAALMKQLCRALRNESQAKAFIAAASPKTRAVWDKLVWCGNQPLSRIEDELGVQIATKKKGVTGVFEPWLIRSPEFPFVVLYDANRFYRGYNNEDYRRGIVVTMAPAVSEALRKYMPKPKGYYIVSEAEAPEAAAGYRCDAAAPENFRFLAEYIDTGRLKLTKAKKIRKACLREIDSMIGGGEFFAGAIVPEELEFLRTSLMASFLNGPGRKAGKAMLSSSPENLGKAFRSMIIALFTNPQWIVEHLLTHLNGSLHVKKGGLDPLFELFARVEIDGWVTDENLARFLDYREISFDFFVDRYYVWVHLDQESPGLHPYQSPRIGLEEDDYELLSLPLVRGVAFMLAAMGFAEIRYNLPDEVGPWLRNGRDYLTPFDGLSAIRLTPLGAYAFGKTDELEIDTSARDRVRIVLNEHRLTLTCREPDRMMELLLGDYMEKISDGCYRMTRQSLLHGCKKASDVAERIEHFKNRIPAEIPPYWQKFFDDVVADCVALKRKPGYVVYRISDTPELRRLFLSDPVLREKSIKTSGPGVAIKKEDLPAVSRRLASLGYLME